MDGRLVVSRTHRILGVGKVSRIDGSHAVVEWFDSIADPTAHSETVALTDLIAWSPDQQCRVYYRSADGWRVGRVLDEELGSFLIRPPGEGADIWLPGEDLYVRWDQPLRDPVALMQSLGMESPHHFQGRHHYVKSLLDQHAACGAMAALPSSAVEIYDHQVDVAARVLADPVQRYLLADEVGLGKTIEAGFIVRQRLLDDPECSIRILVPHQIRRQWESELLEKFFVDDFILSNVHVLSLEEASSWNLPPGSGPPDLLVIDEAHHVAGWAHAPRPLRDRYEAATRLAHAASSLLLLSATPVAHREETFLAMLHLLDPENYGLDQVTAFRRRVADRHELSRAMVLFRPGQRLRRMAANADRLRGLLSGDEAALALLEEILRSPADVARAALDGRIRALRAAISERHRIHHRMLRHRRDDVSGFPVRGRKLDARVEIAGDGFDQIDAWIDRWKNALAEDAGGRPDMRVVPAFLDRALAFPGMLRAMVEARCDRRLAAQAELTPVEQDILSSHPPGAAELEVLRSSVHLPLEDVEEARAEAVVECVFDMPRRTKTVVFCTFTATANFLGAALAERLAPGQLALHLASMDLDEARSEVRRFSDDQSCNVLVCDAGAEEGLNLQFADVVLHAEVPFAPNRLEQRIGRLDRHGPVEPVRSLVLADRHGAATHLNTWVRCLDDGFGVFDRSIAAYQFVVDGVMPDIAGRLLDGGLGAVDELTTTLPDRLDAERLELREQDQLDAIETFDLRQPVADGIRQSDEDWEELEAAAEGLIATGRGHLRFARIPDYRDARLCSYWATSPLRGGEPLVAASDLVRFMLGTYSDHEQELLGTFDRSLALRHPGTRVWRVGDRFLDGLLRYARERDDRGRAYALWRHAPDLPEEEVTAALRFDFIVEPAVPVDRDNASSRALGRRAIEILQPWFETAWITTELAEVPQMIARRMGAKYSTKLGDERLGADRWDEVAELAARAELGAVVPGSQRTGVWPGKNAAGRR